MWRVDCWTDVFRYGLRLTLIPFGEGFSFLWQDGDGRDWCTGWAGGSALDATCEAIVAVEAP